ncbi:MAG: hypothetical protein SVU88_01440 [Candidatus Nanohaloarchaea archaeon]|nr:hypothetical protein [Candidatus Nanohaloarchaea archaeon]
MADRKDVEEIEEQMREIEERLDDLLEEETLKPSQEKEEDGADDG